MRSRAWSVIAVLALAGSGCDWDPVIENSNNDGIAAAMHHNDYRPAPREAFQGMGSIGDVDPEDYWAFKTSNTQLSTLKDSRDFILTGFFDSNDHIRVSIRLCSDGTDLDTCTGWFSRDFQSGPNQIGTFFMRFNAACYGCFLFPFDCCDEGHYDAIIKFKNLGPNATIYGFNLQWGELFFIPGAQDPPGQDDRNPCTPSIPNFACGVQSPGASKF